MTWLPSSTSEPLYIIEVNTACKLHNENHDIIRKTTDIGETVKKHELHELILTLQKTYLSTAKLYSEVGR